MLQKYCANHLRDQHDFNETSCCPCKKMIVQDDISILDKFDSHSHVESTEKNMGILKYLEPKQYVFFV